MCDPTQLQWIQCCTAVGRGRNFIRVALCQKLITVPIEHLVKNERHTQYWYSTNSIIGDHILRGNDGLLCETVSIFIALLPGPQQNSCTYSSEWQNWTLTLIWTIAVFLMKVGSFPFTKRSLYLQLSNWTSNYRKTSNSFCLTFILSNSHSCQRYVEHHALIVEVEPGSLAEKVWCFHSHWRSLQWWISFIFSVYRMVLKKVMFLMNFVVSKFYLLLVERWILNFELILFTEAFCMAVEAGAADKLGSELCHWVSHCQGLFDA